MSIDLPRATLAAFFSLAVTGGLVTSCYDSAQHDRQIQAGFRNAVLKEPVPHVMKVETQGVTREGFLNKGAALTGDINTQLIVASTPEAACWYTTLRVTEGQENLPFWQKLFGGSEDEIMYANQKFDNYTCAPTGNGQTIESILPSKTVTLAPKP